MVTFTGFQLIHLDLGPISKTEAIILPLGTEYNLYHTRMFPS